MRRLCTVLLAGRLAGCGGQIASETFTGVGEALSSPTPEARPTTIPTPEPTVSREVAGAAYLALVDAYNVVLCEQTRALDSGDLLQATGAYAVLAEATRTLADGLRAIELPPELVETKADLLQAFAAAEQSKIVLANAATVEEFNALLDASGASNAAAASLSHFLRAELGLESTPGSC